MDAPFQFEDEYNRNFRSLRLSLLEECNLACLYCVSENEFRTGEKDAFRTRETMSPEKFAALVARLRRAAGIYSVRLTGGEPTLYKPLVRLVELLKKDGTPRVYLTTNGIRLSGMLADLKKAGLDGVNISLDALTEETYRAMGRRGDASRVLRGIEEAVALGLNTKLNCTVYGGMNEKEILPLLEYAGKRNARIRFLELMNMGHLYDGGNFFASPLFVSQERILEAIGARYEYEPLRRKPSAKANYWQTKEGWVFGIIANHSAPFCRDCNRLRLDSKGRLYGCLTAREGFTLREETTDEELHALLQKSMDQKQKESFTGGPLSMKAVGG